MPQQYDRLVGEIALLRPGYDCNSPIAPNYFIDRLVSGYRRTQVAILGDPSCAFSSLGSQNTNPVTQDSVPEFIILAFRQRVA